MSEILFANLDVSTHVLGWLIIFVAQNTALQEELRREITTQSSDMVEFLRKKDSLLHFCYLESLRLRPFTGKMSSPVTIIIKQKSLTSKQFLLFPKVLQWLRFWEDIGFQRM